MKKKMDSNKGLFKLNEILNHLKNNIDFKYIDEKTFKFPEVLNKKG